MLYADVADAVAPTGFVARGGFVVGHGDTVPAHPDGSPTRTVVIVGNVGGSIWPRFKAAEPASSDPLDTWTRSILVPLAESLGAGFVHPSDEPFQPFQRWAQRADDVWQSPIGLLIHPEYGLWHAYRGVLLFPVELARLPVVGTRRSPCDTCIERPCLHTCPVGAFSTTGYDVPACRGHVRSDAEPRCLRQGCAARRACPVGQQWRYGADQMQFHMVAFVGDPA